jgi:hypothetical protein
MEYPIGLCKRRSCVFESNVSRWLMEPLQESKPNFPLTRARKLVVLYPSEFQECCSNSLNLPRIEDPITRDPTLYRNLSLGPLQLSFPKDFRSRNVSMLMERKSIRQSSIVNQTTYRLGIASIQPVFPRGVPGSIIFTIYGNGGKGS